MPCSLPHSSPSPNRTHPPIRCRISQRRDSCSLHCQPAHVTFLARQEFRAPNLMAQPDRNSSRDNKRGNEPNFNWRGIVLIAIAFALIGMALLVRNGGYANIEDVPYNRFIELLDNKQIISDKNLPLTLVVQEGQPTQALVGYYRKQTAGVEQATKFRTTIFLNYNTNLQEKLAAAGIQPAIRTESNLVAQT